MPTIETARGKVDTANLGATLMHEHVSVRTPGIRENWPDLWDQQQAIEDAVARLNAVAERGIGTIVDATPADMGRDPELLRAVQARTSVHIVVTTGIYWEVPRFWRLRSADDLARAFIRDITEGIAGSEIKAGAIKAATVDEVTPVNDLSLRAVARAHRATGAPIITHNAPPTTGLEQARVFEEEGVDLGRVMIGHVGDTTDIEFLKQLIERGCMLGMDRFGMHSELLGLDDRIDTVARLCAEGYAERVMISQDTACTQDWFAEPDAKYPNNPNGNMNLISDEVLPALRKRGVSDEQIDAMLVGNPRRFFEAQGSH
jgi:phosphotriesterase-related protein